MNQRGYTLIEFLVVIVLVGIVSTFAGALLIQTMKSFSHGINHHQLQRDQQLVFGLAQDLMSQADLDSIAISNQRITFTTRTESGFTEEGELENGDYLVAFSGQVLPSHAEINEVEINCQSGLVIEADNQVMAHLPAVTDCDFSLIPSHVSHKALLQMTVGIASGGNEINITGGRDVHR